MRSLRVGASGCRSFAFAILLSVSVTTAWAQTGSKTYQITPSHTGQIQITGVKPPLSVKWSVPLNGTASYPIIAEGMVFVIGGGTPSTL